MTIREMQEEILRLKAERDVCILAHSYQSHDVVEIADFVGDSFALSRKAMDVPQKNVLMCGVRFMAETVKMLSPDKKVILSHPDAGCPMAEQMDPDLILQMKEAHGGIPVVAYINTTAALKCVSDVCVTSSSAVQIVVALPEKELIFVPDINLGTYVSRMVPDKKIHLVHGGCPTHVRMTAADVDRAKAEHPDALLLVHPECRPEVTARADMVGSTSAILAYAKKSPAKEFIIGTENSIANHLAFDCPDKKFYVLSKDCVCHNMALTRLPEVYACLRGEGGEEITLDADTITRAVRPIREMLRLGG